MDGTHAAQEAELDAVARPRAPGMLAQPKQMRCGTLLHTASGETGQTVIGLQLVAATC